MKKIMTIILTALLCFTATSLVACGSDDIKIDPNKSEYTVGIVQLVKHDALDAATQGFRDALTEALTAEGRTVKFEYQDAQNDSTMCATIVNNFVTKKCDLIMANATPALQSAAAATKSIPVLGTSVTDYSVALNLKSFNGVVGTNVSGTSDLAPLTNQAQMILDLVPSAQKIGLLYCSAEPNSSCQVKEVKSYLEGKGKTCSVYTFTDSNDLPAVVASAAAASDAIYVPTDNTVAANKALIKAACYPENGKVVPVIAGEEGICSGCGIATLSISYYNLGKKTGEMAAKILLGKEDITKIQVGYDETPVKKYNEELCEKAGITDDKLTEYTKLTA